MTPGTPPPLPGSMTVPPLYGWENIAVVLVLLVLAAVAVGLVLSTGKAESGRSEFQAWLDGRSTGGDPDIRTAPGSPDVRPEAGDAAGRR